MDDETHLLQQLEKLRTQGFITELGYREMKKSITSGEAVNAKTIALLQMQPSSPELKAKQLRGQRSGSSHALRGPMSQDGKESSPKHSRTHGGSDRRPSLPSAQSNGHDKSGTPASRLAQVVANEAKQRQRKPSVHQLVVPQPADGNSRPSRRSAGMSLADKRASLGYTYEEALRDPAQASLFPQVHLPLSPRSAKGASMNTSQLLDEHGHDGDDSDSSDYDVDGKGYELVGDAVSRPLTTVSSVGSPYALATADNVTPKTQSPAHDRLRKASASQMQRTGSFSMSIKRRQRSDQSVRRPMKKPTSHITKLQSLLTKKSATPNRTPASDFRASNSPAGQTSTLARSALRNKPPAPPLKSPTVTPPPGQADYLQQRNAVTNLTQLLTWYSSRNSKAVAHAVLNSNGSVSASVTYTALAAQARKVAEALLSYDDMVQCAPYSDGSDDAVLICLDPTNPKAVLLFWQAMFGCLRAGLVAVPYWLGEDLVQGSSGETKCRQCMQACNVKAVLTDKDTLKHFGSSKTLLADVYVLRLDALPSVSKSKQHTMATDRSSGAALLLPTIDAATNCLPVVVTHSTLLSHCQRVEPVLGHTPESVVVASMGVTSPEFVWLGLAAALTGCQVQWAGLGGDKVASTVYNGIIKGHKCKVGMHVLVDHTTLQAMCEYAVEPNARKAKLSQLKGLAVVSHGDSYQKAIDHLKHLHTLEVPLDAIAILSVSKLAGVVTHARLPDILARPLQASLGLHQRGVIMTSKSTQEAIDLLPAGLPLPGGRLAVVSKDSHQPARLGELGEVLISAKGCPGMAYSGMTGLSQSTFGFPVETAVAGSPVKMHLFSRTGLVGAVAATPHGEQLFLAGTSMSVFHIDKAWCAAADVANTVLRASKAHSATASNITKHGVAVLAPTIDKRPRLVVLIEMSSDVEDNVMLLDSWLYRMSHEIESQHDVQPFCLAFAAAGALPRLTNGTIDFAQSTRMFMSAQLSLWHCVIAADACLRDYQPLNSPLQDAQMTPLKQMAVMDTSLSELTGSTLVLNDAVKAARTVISLLVKLAATTPKRALYHVVDYKGREEVITAEGLLKRTRRVAHLLDKKGVQPGDHVLLATPLSSNQAAAFHACLLVGALPVVAYAPRDKIEASQWHSILTSIIKSTTARFVLTSDKVAKYMKSTGKDWATANGVQEVLSVDSAGSKEYYGIHVPHTREDTAFLEFSITATGVLAGVEASHQTMLTLGQAVADQLSLNDAKEVLVHLNGQTGLSHAIYTYVALFTTNTTLVCIDNHPKTKPTAWLKLLTERRMSVVLMNHSALLTCVDLATDKQTLEWFTSLNLNALKRCFILTQDRPWHAVFEAFKTVFKASKLPSDCLLPVLENRCNGFLAANQLARPPLYVDSRALKRDELRLLERGSPHGVPVVSMGLPSPAVKVAVVDPEKEKVCPGDKIGELWFSSVFNAPSYAGLGEEEVAVINDELLFKQLAGKTSSYARSGLLGFVNNGQVYVTGQLEECIVVGGERYNPVDLEDTMERCHDQLQVGGVMVWQMEDGSVIAAVEVDREQDCFKIAPLVAAAVVTRHKLALKATMFLPRNVIPIDARGQKQRRLLRTMLAEEKLEPYHIVLNLKD
eukprot:TRINITY_DN11520_c0_g1_i2.p1 TRINITY_DN11520_c0_g1~~TRINITY_DN11520_c0_g1_i2.p1  ORF type:complete len:1609 (+),score=418.05 TRINITY_DN11520_c0_g1_i2:176-5002(+)